MESEFEKAPSACHSDQCLIFSAANDWAYAPPAKHGLMSDNGKIESIY